MHPILHYFLHLGFPFFIAYFFFKKDWQKVYLILLATMLVDLDHLVASPVFQANRCSINFHPLHSYFAIAVYFLLLFLPKPYRIIGIGLLLHMMTDLLDCICIYEKCKACLADAPALELLQWISPQHFIKILILQFTERQFLTKPYL